MLRLEEKLRTGRLMHGRSSNLTTSGAKSLGSKLPFISWRRTMIISCQKSRDL